MYKVFWLKHYVLQLDNYKITPGTIEWLNRGLRIKTAAE